MPECGGVQWNRSSGVIKLFRIFWHMRTSERLADRYIFILPIKSAASYHSITYS